MEKRRGEKKEPPTFILNQIVWAKVYSFDWWPAWITGLPSPMSPSYRVNFYNDTSHSFLQHTKIKKFGEHKYVPKKNQKLDKEQKEQIEKLKKAIKDANEDLEWKPAQRLEEQSRLEEQQLGSSYQASAWSSQILASSQFASSQFASSRFQQNEDESDSLAQQLLSPQHPTFEERQRQAKKMRQSYPSQLPPEQGSTDLKEPRRSRGRPKKQVQPKRSSESKGSSKSKPKQPKQPKARIEPKQSTPNIKPKQPKASPEPKPDQSREGESPKKPLTLMVSRKILKLLKQKGLSMAESKHISETLGKKLHFGGGGDEKTDQVLEWIKKNSVETIINSYQDYKISGSSETHRHKRE